MGRKSRKVYKEGDSLMWLIEEIIQKEIKRREDPDYYIKFINEYYLPPIKKVIH